MKKPSYGPDKTLDVKVTTRDWSIYRDPAVLLIDQLEKICIEGELELIDTPNTSQRSAARTTPLHATCKPAGRTQIRSSVYSTSAARA